MSGSSSSALRAEVMPPPPAAASPPRAVAGYMHHIRRAAELSVREMLVRFSLARSLPPRG
jgi:hypothetical protein